MNHPRDGAKRHNGGGLGNRSAEAPASAPVPRLQSTRAATGATPVNGIHLNEPCITEHIKTSGAGAALEGHSGKRGRVAQQSPVTAPIQRHSPPSSSSLGKRQSEPTAAPETPTRRDGIAAAAAAALKAQNQPQPAARVQEVGRSTPPRRTRAPPGTMSSPPPSKNTLDGAKGAAIWSPEPRDPCANAAQRHQAPPNGTAAPLQQGQPQRPLFAKPPSAGTEKPLPLAPVGGSGKGSAAPPVVLGPASNGWTTALNDGGLRRDRVSPQRRRHSNQTESDEKGSFLSEGSSSAIGGVLGPSYLEASRGWGAANHAQRRRSSHSRDSIAQATSRRESTVSAAHPVMWVTPKHTFIVAAATTPTTPYLLLDDGGTAARASWKQASAIMDSPAKDGDKTAHDTEEELMLAFQRKLLAERELVREEMRRRQERQSRY